MAEKWLTRCLLKRKVEERGKEPGMEYTYMLHVIYINTMCVSLYVYMCVCVSNIGLSKKVAI